jgi:hypothetical protein
VNHPDHTHNVQHLRISFPPLGDAEHHAALVRFDARLTEVLEELGLSREVSYVGFYRADHNWDNVDTLGACVCGPDRGGNGEGIDNEP